MPAFAARRPELGVEAVEVLSALSGAAVAKQVDAAQVCLTICGAAVNIDLLPTVGAEVVSRRVAVWTVCFACLPGGRPRNCSGQQPMCVNLRALSAIAMDNNRCV